MPNTAQTILEQLNPLIEIASKMILAGVLKKNAILHFTNKGFPFAAAENIVEMAAIRAENFLHNKAI